MVRAIVVDWLRIFGDDPVEALDRARKVADEAAPQAEAEAAALVARAAEAARRAARGPGRGKKTDRAQRAS